MRRLHFIFILIILTNVKTLSQSFNSVNQYLDGIWILENSLSKISNYKVYFNNKLYQIEYDSSDNSTSTIFFEYYFPVNSFLQRMEKVNYNEDSILKWGGNKRNLNKDVVINSKFETINVLHIDSDRKYYAIIYLYTFYNDKRMNHYGFGSPAGQPQEGYLYKRANNLPVEVVKTIKNIKSEVFKKINFQKAIIYSNPNIPTKMYLIKGDDVEVILEQKEWLRIRYYGKKIIEGWIKKADVN